MHALGITEVVIRKIRGALRWLRLQKGPRQSDFPGVTAKEIARIERGELKKPHQQTRDLMLLRSGHQLQSRAF
jgi:hypothetical protein